MAQISLVINDELDTKFRKVVAVKLGLKKGNIKIAVEEALQLWIDHQNL
jgi:hypothetical protein